jgi:citrate lyase subunit beta/citryl-CoA lyase
LRASVERSLRLGFQGRMCIHPDQVTVVNEIFTPSPEEAARAEQFVDASRPRSKAAAVIGPPRDKGRD